MRILFLVSLSLALTFAQEDKVKEDKTVEQPPPLDQQLRPEDLPKINSFSTTTCHPKSVDLMFVIDQSGSIGSRNFATVRQFLINLVNEMTFPGVQVGVVEFNTYASRYFNLNSYTTAAAIDSALSRMPYRGGGTNIASGMNYATRYAFQANRGDRPSVDDVMVVLTDGQDSSNVAAAHSSAAAAGIKTIAIGVGNGISFPELLKVVGDDPLLIHDIKTFNNLSSIIESICEQIATACDGSPCQNSGSCTEINDGKDFTCTCSPLYTGDLCEEFVDPCNSAPCLHDGVCHTAGSQYTCTCTSDFTGANCDTYLNPCDSNPCSNGASCERNSGTTFTCYCPVGFTGTTCQTEICQHGGKFSCDCPYGFIGPYCERTIDFCNSTEIIVNGTIIYIDICGIHGTCSNLESGPSCTCDKGWHGTYCRIDDDDCSPNPCKNGGTCFNQPGAHYTCQCDKLHTGVNCENDIDLCNREVVKATGGNVVIPICGDHGTCEQNSNGSICNCDHGWGGAYCDIEIPVDCTYKGQTHAHNSTWTDHCDQCNCEFGVVQCSRSHWCPQQCAIYTTNATTAAGIKTGCPEYQNCVPESVDCAHETPSCPNPIGWCFPVGYVIVDPRLPPNFHPPKSQIA